MRAFGSLLVLFLLVALGGCDDKGYQTHKDKAAAEKKKAADRKKKVNENLVRQQRELVEKTRSALEPVEQAYRETQANLRSGSSSSYRTDTNAGRTIVKQLKETAELEPTLAMWLIDTTPSALRVTDELRRAALDFYGSGDWKVIQGANPEQLQTVVIGFGAQPKFVTESPTADAAAVKTAFGELSSGPEEPEHTFAAVKAVLDKFLAPALEQRRRMFVVVATDEAGDDPQVADEIVPLLKKHEIPVFVVGVNAPWGMTNPAGEIPGAKKNDLPVYGPESVASERVRIELPSFRSATGVTAFDSGFGPQALERIARAGAGAFLAVRPGGGGTYGGGTAWPGSEQRFDPQGMKKYAPDYISAADYQQAVSANKAKAALVAAAKLPRVDVLKSPPTSFFKRNEADLKRQVVGAQRESAKLSPEIDKMADLLLAGEGDRAKLTEPRWQAGFDLALGRILAVKARCDVYAGVLAALNRGKEFANPEHKTWTLTQADAFEGDSKNQKTAEKAKRLLEGVVKDHPNTPWAVEAAEELKTPLGWKLEES